MGDFLIYGATGYTGTLTAEHAVERGLSPVLAGRRADAVLSLAERLGLRHCVFGLGIRRALVEGLDGMAAVLHAAGPFSTTSAPMADACITAGVTTATSPARSTSSRSSPRAMLVRRPPVSC